MRKMLLALAASAALTAPAHAAIKFSDGFEGETSATTALNYTNFQNWDVTDGTVDLVRQPDFGISCANGNFCVDVNGSTGNPGVFMTKDAFTFNADDIVTVTFNVSGSQRSGLDGLTIGLQLVDPFDFTLLSDTILLNWDAGFGQATVGPAQLAGLSGAFKLFFAGTDPDPDNIGLVIDDVSLDISAVPEPASWAMMIAGFGLVGSALRTNRRRGTLAAA